MAGLKIAYNVVEKLAFPYKGDGGRKRVADKLQSFGKRHKRTKIWFIILFSFECRGTHASIKH